MKTRQEMYVFRKIEARPYKYFCNGKAMSILQPVCVCVCLFICSLRYPAFNAHAPYCHPWSALLYNIFAHFLINSTISEKKLSNTKCVFLFSLQLLSGTFLILRRNERDMIKKSMLVFM